MCRSGSLGVYFVLVGCSSSCRPGRVCEVLRTHGYVFGYVHVHVKERFRKRKQSGKCADGTPKI